MPKDSKLTKFPRQEDPGDQTGEAQEDEAGKEDEVEKPKPESFALGPQPFALLLLNYMCCACHSFSLSCLTNHLLRNVLGTWMSILDRGGLRATER